MTGQGGSLGEGVMDGSAVDGGREDLCVVQRSYADIGPGYRQMSVDIGAAALLSIPHHGGSVAARLMNSAANERERKGGGGEGREGEGRGVETSLGCLENERRHAALLIKSTASPVLLLLV